MRGKARPANEAIFPANGDLAAQTRAGLSDEADAALSEAEESEYYPPPQSAAARRVAAFAPPLSAGVLLLVFWQTGFLHQVFGVDDFTLPLPLKIVGIMVSNAPKIMYNVKDTVIVALAGLFLGSALGYLIAIFATLFPKWGTGGLSLLAAFNAVPIVALAPVITNLTKDVSSDAYIRSMVAKMLVVMLFCAAAMSINAWRGLRELKPFSEDLMLSYAAGRFSVFMKLRIPNSVPYVFTALGVGVPACVISALVSEYFAEYITGVGRQIRENIVLAQYPTAWAYIVTACAIGIVFYWVLMLCKRLIKT
ncbi:MAG: ABC transporter permease subunit [Clostridiales Family XIII bacterium]|jgi:NitT/TauT family transport system permease protein|nr:ABC transporter permease subunit [Clostridiales Family XIII bacterium]